jgi:hypothetical protein
MNRPVGALVFSFFVNDHCRGPPPDQKIPRNCTPAGVGAYSILRLSARFGDLCPAGVFAI